MVNLASSHQTLFNLSKLDAWWTNELPNHMVQFCTSREPERTDTRRHDPDWPVVWQTWCKIFIPAKLLTVSLYSIYQNADSQANAKPKCRPAVKFRNIDENALQAIQIGDQTNDGGVSEHGDEPESDSESEDETETNAAGPLPPQAFEFEIDTEIDINSMALRDMVAIDPVVREETRPRKETSKATQQVTTAPNWNW